MNEAIKLAIEKGGYRNEGINTAWILDGSKSWNFDVRFNGLTQRFFIKTKTINKTINQFHNEQIGSKGDLAVDPLFWQALTTALQLKPWYRLRNGIKTLVEKEEWEKRQIEEQDRHTMTIPEAIFTAPEMKWITSWQYYAHQYFDLILIGGDTEQFWKELIKNS